MWGNMSTQRIVFADELLNSFRGFITDRSGLYFRDHDLKNLENSVTSRMTSLHLDSPTSYYRYITMSDSKEDEFRELLNLLTVNHTYFFRNESQFKALRERVLPEIIQRKIKENAISRRLRIWSAGCSTGEEPYSIAMIVRDLLPDIDSWDVHIFATDASMESLDRAKKGIYNSNSIRLVGSDYVDKYFRSNTLGKNTMYQIGDEIKKMVTFAFHNLIEDDFPQEMDIVFCRNVVIYFDIQTTMKIMNKFHTSLLDEGYLFIGYSETLQFMRDKFQMIDWQDAIYYSKSKQPRQDGMAEVIADFKEDISFDKIIEDISRMEVKTDMGEDFDKKISERKIQDLLIDIVKWMHLKKYDSALSLISEAIDIDKNNTEIYYLAAEIYISQGKFTDAKSQLFFVSKLNPLFFPAYYLLGCIHMQEEEFDAAKENFKKALYLRRDFSLAHFYLGNIYKQEGNIDNAIREYRNTLNGLSSNSPGDIVAYSGGFNTATLASVCRDNLERLKVSQ